MSNLYLMHHGIKGQEWGVQNGPPYPLNPSKDYSSTEKKANNSGNNKTSSDKLEDQDLLTRQKVKESSDDWTDREIKASNLGLKALNTTRGSKFGYDPEKGITESDRWWFFFEDQTDGCGMIADLVNQGKSKKQILSYIDQAKKRTDDIAFELSNVYKSDQFIDACISIKQKEVKHSDMSDSSCMYLCHHGIKGQEWGVQNGPPYPLSDKIRAVAYRGGFNSNGEQVYSTDKKSVKAARKIIDKHINVLSDKDLQDYKTRLMLENSIEDITGTNWYKKEAKRSRDNILHMFSDATVNAGKTMITNTELYAINAGLRNAFAKSGNVSPDVADIITKVKYKED